MVPPCGFDSQFLMPNDVEHLLCAYEQVCFPSHELLRLSVPFHIPHPALSAQKCSASVCLTFLASVFSCFPATTGAPYRSQLADPDGGERTSNQARTGLTDRRRRQRQRQGQVARQSQSNYSVMDEVKPKVSGQFFPPSQATSLSQHLPQIPHIPRAKNAHATTIRGLIRLPGLRWHKQNTDPAPG